MRVALALTALLLVPGAAALSISAGRDGDTMVVTLVGDEAAHERDVVLSHLNAAGARIVDRVVPVTLAPHETIDVRMPGLADEEYAVDVVDRGGASPDARYEAVTWNDSWGPADVDIVPMAEPPSYDTPGGGGALALVSVALVALLRRR